MRQVKSKSETGDATAGLVDQLNLGEFAGVLDNAPPGTDELVALSKVWSRGLVPIGVARARSLLSFRLSHAPITELSSCLFLVLKVSVESVLLGVRRTSSVHLVRGNLCSVLDRMFCLIVNHHPPRLSAHAGGGACGLFLVKKRQQCRKNTSPEQRCFSFNAACGCGRC